MELQCLLKSSTFTINFNHNFIEPRLSNTFKQAFCSSLKAFKCKSKLFVSFFVIFQLCFSTQTSVQLVRIEMTSNRKEISKVVYNDRCGYAVAFYTPHMRDPGLEIIERSKKYNIPARKKYKPEPSRNWKVRESPSEFIERKNREREIESLHDTYEKAKDFCLLKSVDNKYYTINEYTEHVQANQKDKDENIRFIY